MASSDRVPATTTSNDTCVAHRLESSSDDVQSVILWRLRDSCSAVALCFWALHHNCKGNLDVLGRLECSPSTEARAVATRCRLSVLSKQAVAVGRSKAEHLPVYLLLPSYSSYFYDFTIFWGQSAFTEMARQYVGRCRIAQLQTLGGGWASLHRADKALECAILLYDCAAAVFDGDVVRKCRLFIGWAHLWNNSPQMAIQLFRMELAEARKRGDEVHERRCLHAIANATHNPRLAVGGAHTGHYDLTDCWSRVFIG